MAAITNYIDVVPLATAKAYLRIDSDITESDTEIEIMINSAFEYIERNTNHICKPKEKNYIFKLYDCNAVNVYDFPINSVAAPANANDYQETVKALYTRYQSLDTGNLEMVLNVGYTDTDDVPQLIVQAVLEMVKNWYYSSDENSAVKNYLSNPALEILMPLRRFIF